MMYMYFCHFTSSMTRVDRRNRLATANDIAQVEVNHKVINRAYRSQSEGDWTTEALSTNEPLSTIQLGAAEHYPDCGEYKKEVYTPTHTELVPKDQQVYLGLFSVDPAHLSRSIGRKLVEAALAHAKENEPGQLIKWYNKLGFIDYGEKVNFPDTSCIVQEDAHFSVLRLPF
ncbi:hypothetical protein EC957_001596 [Mortierella hygrophila]|uniref:N-acetyltransferase domain-containing protein n=1 Tax=Mortierella hygrophila TaxID=979708 RepID=A0A9P6K7M6_9FUNG|nr:hypothetical protein EC957_001596 [Mortierella hygrophila]